MRHALDPLLDALLSNLERHALDRPGAYARWTQPAPDGTRDLGLNPYGCADAANLLYTLDRLPDDPDERASWVAVLRSLQDPADGLYHEATHHPIHTTAHCLGALELFDARPEARVSGLDEWRDPAALEDFLEALAWRENPWIESHRGAGLYAALVLAGEAEASWRASYFAWLRRETDPATGLLRRGSLPQDPRFLFPALAGTFHYLFNHQHEGVPHAHAAALVDTCLRIFREELFPFSSFVGFAEIDWVYCLHRSVRQSGHRATEAREALRAFAARYLAFLDGLDPETDLGLDDLHALFGSVCALAELQQALPDELHSSRPLRLVLDRRPFI